jgi:hypothetical protein
VHVGWDPESIGLVLSAAGLGALIVVDLTKGTGRFNVTEGAIVTAQGIGASLSMFVAGWVARVAGYNAAFLVLAAECARPGCV